MIEHCAIHADYVGIKTLSGRKVVQITCEVALERLEEVITLLGSPNPSTGKPVGIALLHDVEVDVKREIAEKAVKEKRAFTDFPLSQQAAMLCKDKRFCVWVTQKINKENGTSLDYSDDQILQWLYSVLQIKSRADLDNEIQHPIARIEFRRVRDEFYASTKQYPEQRG